MAEAELAADARRAAVLVAACAFAGGVLALNRALVGVFYDDGLYATLAIALARGHGYVQANLPGAPAAIHYPPVYPVVLAPLFGIFSIDTAGFLGKILNLICSVAAAGLIAWHAIRARLLGDAAPRWLTPGLVAGSAVAMPVLQTQSVLFAEPLFALLLAAAILVSDSPGVSREIGRAHV